MTHFRADRLQTAVWAAVGLGLLALFYLLSPILTPFAIAAVFAYICNPAVNWMVRRRVPRIAAVLIVILGMGTVVMLLVLILVPLFYKEAVTLMARMPELLNMIEARVLPLLQEWFGISVQLDSTSLKGWFTEHGEKAGDMLPAILSGAREGGMALIAFGANLILIPIVMLYLLQEWPRLMAALQDVIPRPMLARTMRILGEIDSVLSQFMRGQLSVMLILAVFYSIGLWIAGLDFALPVGIIAGLLSFIPFVGAAGGLIIAVFAALLQGDGMSLLVAVVIVYALGQLIESYGLTPYLVGDRIGLHPLAVIFALMAFGQLFGFVGMLIALPASAAILVGLREVRKEWLTSPVYLGDDRGPGSQVYVGEDQGPGDAP